MENWFDYTRFFCCCCFKSSCCYLPFTESMVGMFMYIGDRIEMTYNYAHETNERLAFFSLLSVCSCVFEVNTDKILYENEIILFFFYYTDTYLWNVRVCRIICAQLTYYSITIPLLILLFFFPSFSIFQCFFYSSDFFSPNCWWCFLLFLFIFFYVAVVYPKGNIL